MFHHDNRQHTFKRNMLTILVMITLFHHLIIQHTHATTNTTTSNNSERYNYCSTLGGTRAELNYYLSTSSNNDNNNKETVLNLQLRADAISVENVCIGFAFKLKEHEDDGILLKDKQVMLDVPHYMWCSNIQYVPKDYTKVNSSYTSCVIMRNGSVLESCNESQLAKLIFSSSKYFTNQKQIYSFTPIQLKLDVSIGEHLLNGKSLDSSSNITIDVVFKSSEGLIMYERLLKNQSYSSDFLKKEISQMYQMETYRTASKLSSTTTSRSEECDVPYFSTRPFYRIWKAASCLIVVIVCVLTMIALTVKRKHRFIVSRFFSPYISTIVLLVGSAIRFIFVISAADNDDLNIMVASIIVFVFLLYTLQITRYYLSRWFYKNYFESERKKTSWFRIASSKSAFLIMVGVIIVVESGVFLLVSLEKDYHLRTYICDYFTLAAFAAMIFISSIFTILYIIANCHTIKELRTFSKVLKWYFVHDDTFKYHGEFITIALTSVFGLLFFLLSFINGTFMSSEHSIPLTTSYVKHIAGYSLYGLSKTFFEVSLVLFEPGYLLIHCWIDERKRSLIENSSLKDLKEEMDLFLATKIDSVDCVDVFKRFLINEFRLELLQLYLYISKNPKVDREEVFTICPPIVMDRVIDTSLLSKNAKEEGYDEMTRWRKKLITSVTINMIDCFQRLKQTPVYRTHYVGMKEFEAEFLTKVLTTGPKQKPEAAVVTVDNLNISVV